MTVRLLPLFCTLSTILVFSMVTVNGTVNVAVVADESPANVTTMLYDPAARPGFRPGRATPSAPVFAITDRDPTVNVTFLPASGAPFAVSFAATGAASVNCAVVLPTLASRPVGVKHLFTPTL